MAAGRHIAAEPRQLLWLLPACMADSVSFRCGAAAPPVPGQYCDAEADGDCSKVVVASATWMHRRGAFWSREIPGTRI